MIRRWFAVAMAVAALVSSSACESEKGYRPPPGAPSLLPVWGARETDGKLQIWTGAPCTGITTLSLGYNMGGPELRLASIRPEGADVEYLTLGGPYPGFTVTESWPADTDWRRADQLVLQVDGTGVNFGSGSRVSEIVDGSPDHPPDTYWFDGVGWLTPAGVAGRDGKDFAAVCTPNPQATA
ncbi:hypothetical protein [Mycobacterium sp. NPDC050041]|uniref:hypothetical protein n=1 Tax=Mycobacterium sp. NPDC050041 TaxID=3364293 RepID=UPI003C2E08DA